ncbi:MAG: transcriptional regulator [Cytophagaceae bacterium]|nr:MAG: transcriptional regulator [Cytophagaceae bacterium]
MTAKTNAIELAVEMTMAWLKNPSNRATVNEVPVILRSMYDAVAKLSSGSDGSGLEVSSTEFIPAVSVRKSLAHRDYIVSLIDGKPYKALRRHLTMNGLTPEEYRERYGLKSDYPMVSKGYSEVRRAMAMKIGLGRKPSERSTLPGEPISDTASAKPRREVKAGASGEAE